MRSCVNQKAEKKTEEKPFCYTRPINYRRQRSIWEASPRERRQLTNYTMVLMLPVCQANYWRFFFFFASTRTVSENVRRPARVIRLTAPTRLRRGFRSGAEAACGQSSQRDTACVRQKRAGSESCYITPVTLILMCVMTRA